MTLSRGVSEDITEHKGSPPRAVLGEERSPWSRRGQGSAVETSQGGWSKVSQASVTRAEDHRGP